MSIPVGRVGDIGIGVCSCHDTPVGYTTIIGSGAPTVNANGSPVALIGSVGISSCGHSTIALTGSSTVRATGIGIHRLGDIGQNCDQYILVTASPNVNAGV